MQPVASRGVEGLRGGEGAPPAKAAVTLKNRAPTPLPPTRGGVNKRESLLSGVPPAVSLALTQCGVPPYKTTKRDRARHTLSSRCQSMASPAALQSRLRRAGRTAAWRSRCSRRCRRRARCRATLGSLSSRCCAACCSCRRARATAARAASKACVFLHEKRSSKKKSTPAEIRTLNLLLRRQTPYPLGHGG